MSSNAAVTFTTVAAAWCNAQLQVQTLKPMRTGENVLQILYKVRNKDVPLVVLL